MSLKNFTLINVRTAGSDTNGGGTSYKSSGCNLASNNVKQVGFAGLTSGPFAAGDVGHNILIMYGDGWTFGLYIINSVNVAGVATLNNDPGANKLNGSYYLCSGLDYSQQTAAQYSFADLASSNGTSNPAAVSSASHSFVANDVGNLINISAGTNWTAGVYQIVSVSGGAATLDRACGTVAALSGGTYAVGGSLQTIAKAHAVALTTSVPSNNCIGGIIFIQSGTYTFTTTLDLGSPQWVKWWGYNTNYGDDGTPPLITTSTNSIDLLKINTANNPTNFLIYNINFSNTATIRARGIFPYNVINFNATAGFSVRRSVWDGFTSAITDRSASGFQYISVQDTEVKNSTSYGIDVSQGTFAYIDGCYIHNNGNHGLNIGMNSVTILHSVFSSNSGDGCRINSGVAAVNFCDFANNTGNGLALNNTFSIFITFSNSIFYGNSIYGFSFSSPANANVEGFNNAYGGNTSGPVLDNSILTTPTIVNLTANPFISSTDFTLNSTAGGGTSCKQAGFAGPFVTNKPDIGAVQQGSSGGSTSAPYAYIQ